MPGRRRDLPAAGPGGSLLLIGPASTIREELSRHAAAAGLRTEAIEVGALSSGMWTAADLVVIDAGCADQVSSARLPRRAGVLLVTASPPAAGLWSAAVHIGAEQVLELPAGQASLSDRLSDAASGSGQPGLLMSVIGGCGGAGASTLATALAVNAARSGQQPVLLGADPWDGGIDVALGAEAVSGPRWPDLAAVSGRLPTSAIVDGLPSAHGVRFVSSARRSPSRVPFAALSAVVAAARRTGGPVVVDLPRGGAEAARWLGGVADLGLVVCPATVPGALAARSLVAEIGWTTANSGVVVRIGRGQHIDDESLESTIGLPVILRVRDEARLVRQRELGEPPGLPRRGRLARSCTDLWRLAAEHCGPTR